MRLGRLCLNPWPEKSGESRGSGMAMRARYFGPFAAVVAGYCLASPGALAQTATTVADLSRLSIDELANVEIESVSKRPEPLSQAAAAVYVISADDIRRSGATSLPEALRLAPNLEVARINAYEYTITARGFNSPEASNKLQVLIDGRSVYSPLGSTVFWEGIDIPMSQIVRIEVISGPGGTLYGANAVNGVINVITKGSADTQGFVVDAAAGSTDRTGTASYGGAIGDAATFRLYATGFDRSATLAVDPTDHTNDAWHGGQVGFRVDGTQDGNGFTVQGDLYNNDTYNMFLERAWGGNALARWSTALDDGSTLGVKAYYDQDNRVEPGLKDLVTTYDVQAQENTTLWQNHQFVWGGEFRLFRETLVSDSIFGFAQPTATISLGNAFVQDQFPITSDLKATFGIKLEDNSLSGLDYMPNGRLAWQANADTLFWAAISRAVRTPSRIDRDLEAPGILAPSPDFQSEKLIAYELGYRGQITSNFTLSVSTFYNDYNDIRSDGLTNGGFPIVFENGIQGDTYGIEVWGEYRILDWWRLAPGFNTLHKDFHLKPGYADFSQFESVGEDPAYQAQLRSEMDVTSALEVDATLRDVDHVTRDLLVGPNEVVTPYEVVPSYIEADARIGWRIADRWELSLEGDNLLHNRHLEVNDPSTTTPRYIQRAFLISLHTGF
jgi:iron complex outermembrane receptor protein